MAEIINVIWALLIVVSAIGGLAYLVKKSGFIPGATLLAKNKQRLTIIESKALDTRHRLIIAKKDNKEYLLALGPGVITLLDSDEKERRFKDMLDQNDTTGNSDA